MRRAQALINDIDNASSTVELAEMITGMSKFVPVKHSSFTYWRAATLSPEPDWRGSNFPEGFHRSYEREDAMLRNPMTVEAVRGMLPVEWVAAARRHPQEAERLLAHNARFDVSPIGASIPAHARGGGRRALFGRREIEASIPAHARGGGLGVMNVDFAVDEADWRKHAFVWLSRLHLAALHIHARLENLERDMKRRHGLSAREIDALRLAAHGKKAKEIAHDLNLSEQTVNFYLSRARAKLRVANTTEAAVRAAELGLLRPDPAAAA